MQKSNNIILIAATFLAAVLMSVSCLEKDDPAIDMQNVMIELSVSAEGMTKATPTASESAVNSLRIYAFAGERLAGYAIRGKVTDGEPFYMDLELPASGTHEVDFYVVANEAQMAYQNGVVGLSENMTRSQLEAIKFTGLTSGSALPMYCIQKEDINVSEISAISNTEAGHEGHFILTKKVELDLSRSLAKISLYAAKTEGASTTPQILDARILAAGTRTYSYLFPQLPETLSSVAPRPNDRTIHSSAVDINAEVEKGSNEAKVASNYDLVLADAYLPEVNSEDVVLRVEYAMSAGGEIRTGFVYMPQIKRNTHYKVCILISSEGQLIINYEVLPWEDNVISDIHFDYPTHSYLRESIPTTESDLAAKPSQQAQMSEAQPFEGYFQLTYPTNDAWTPTLMGPQAGNCEVKVYQIDGLVQNEVPEVQWPINASDKWYKIKVTPDPMKVDPGEEVKLAITYKAAGFETIEYMLINGSYQEYYWPYNGASQQDANYVIITMVN
ncbi:MAG: hypothetical protein IKV05_00865 [Bacteroidales bacterium]|nr:hypothetical protein [Bacteroidales bacterium]